MKRNRLGGGEMDSRVEYKGFYHKEAAVAESKRANTWRSRRLPSLQALGGHRASHKKPRPAGDGHGQAQGGAAKLRVHECSICGLELAVGQALGDHMRRHRAMTEGLVRGVVDLNMPPPLEDDTKLAPWLEIAPW